MTALAALLSYPSSVRPAELDISPPVEASNLFVASSASASHAPTIVVPAGLAASKLLIFVIADRQLTGTTLNTTLAPATILETASGPGTLFGYGLFYDAPPAGTATVGLTFAGACIPKVLLAVLSGASPGAPFAGASTIDGELADVIPPDRFSTCIDLIGATQETFWEHPGTQELLDRDEDAGAAASVKRPANPVVQRMEWTPDVAPPDFLQIVMAVAPGSQASPTPEAFETVSSWAHDETTGVAAVDAQGVSSGTWTAPERGVATIVTGGTTSTGLNGVNSVCVIPQPAGDVWLLPSYTFGGYCQIDALPLVNTHGTIASKESGGTPGGFGAEGRNVAGQLRFRAYTRTAAGDSVFFGSADGVVNLTPGVAFLWAITVDPTDLAQPSKLMIKQAGGTGVVVATSTNTEGLQNNVRTLRFGLYHTGASPLAGVIKNNFLGSGAMTLTEFNALAAPVSITHGTPAGAITVPDIPQGQLAVSSVTDIDIAPFATGLTGGALTFTEVSDAAARASFVNNGTASALIRLTMPAAAGSPTNETATFTVSEAGGPASNVFQVSWTRPAAGGVSFPFVTIARPANQNQGLPPFNATAPRSVSRIDPMSGLEYWQILPHHASRQGNGQMILANGNFSGFHVKATQGHQSSPNDTSFNCDGSLLLLYSTGSRSLDSQSGGPITPAILMRTSDWRILDVDMPDMGAAFWHPDNPELMIRWSTGGSWRTRNMITGADQALFSISGYTMATSNGGNTSVTNPGRNGYTRKWGGLALPGAGGPRYQAMAARRVADNEFVLFRVRLDPPFGKSGDIEFGPVVENNNAASWAVLDGLRYHKGMTSRISATGNFCIAVPAPGTQVGAFEPPASGSVSAANAYRGVIGLNAVLTSRHPDTTIVNGHDVIVGVGAGNPTALTSFNINTGVIRRIASIPNGANPHTTSTQNRFDRAETYGAIGGLLAGRRYALFSKTNGMWGISLDPDDEDNIRYIGNPRGTTDGDDNMQADAVIDPTGRYALWKSNWRGTGGGIGGSGGPCTAYITALGEAWYNSNNDGS